MKKTVSFLIIMTLLFSLVACMPTVFPDTDTLEEIRIAVMQGPTGIGLVKYAEDHKQDENPAVSVEIMPSQNGAQLIMASLLDGSLDFACLPCNVAATAYNKGADIRVAAVNTLGVLVLLENGNTVQSLDDLHGKTVYTVNKGSTTEYSLRYILEAAGITDCTVEFEEQSTVQTRLAGEEDVLVVLPQPLATVVTMQNVSVRTVLALGDEYSRLTGGENLVTGVLVVRGAFADKHPELVEAFLRDYEQSVDYVRSNPKDASVLVEQYGIIAKAAIAEKAIPNCSLVYMAGAKMKTEINNYLYKLYAMNPASVGGAMPTDDFYYLGGE